MNSLTSCTDLGWSVSNNSEKGVCDLLQRVLKASEPQLNRPERRLYQRHPFPCLLTLTPIADKEIKVVDEPLVVVGKRLALRSLEFYHCGALPYRRVIISFDEIPWDVHLVLLVSWCRFLRPGWYDSGGRFTHVVTPARQTLTNADDWNCES